MRVLHFYKTSLPDTMGGIEQVIDQIARCSSKFGVTSEVLSLTPERVERTIEINGYLVHRARLDLQIASTGFSASAFLRFSQLAKKADVIHYHFPWPFMDVVHFATRVNKPTVVTYHSDIIRQKYLLKLYRPLKNKFLARVDRIVATSPNYLATSDVLIRFSDKVSVIPIGLDKASYPQPEPERLQYWREKFGPKFFLFVGVLRYYKGLHLLIEASHGTEYPVVIVGAGPTEQELKEQVAKLGMRNIHFMGHLDDIDKVALLTLCIGVVFPSNLRSEAFGISLLEGAMYGKPMISSEIGTGTTFINIHGETGLVIQPHDPAALRQAMHYLWEHPAEASVMGKCAEERYWKYFTAEQMVKSYVELYGDLVKQHQSA
jgi:O-antigen biosynthesis rhamnosyltransferase